MGAVHLQILPKKEGACCAAAPLIPFTSALAFLAPSGQMKTCEAGSWGDARHTSNSGRSWPADRSSLAESTTNPGRDASSAQGSRQHGRVKIAVQMAGDCDQLLNGTARRRSAHYGGSSLNKQSCTCKERHLYACALELTSGKPHKTARNQQHMCKPNRTQ